MDTELEAILNRSPVWRRLYETDARYRAEWDAGRGPGRALDLRGKPPIVNHWDALHRYAVENCDDWDQQRAKAFYRRWKRSIPNTGGCRCREKWKKLGVVFDFSSPRAFFESAWLGHDTVSELIGKPRFTLEECVSIWGFPALELHK